MPAIFHSGNLLLQDINSTRQQRLPASCLPYPDFSAPAQSYRRSGAPAVSAILNVNEEWGPHGVSRYHSLQLKLNKRYSSGLTFLTFYTWSKNMTNVEGGPNRSWSGRWRNSISAKSCRRSFDKYGRSPQRFRGKQFL